MTDETLPALLERRFGVDPRTVWAGAATVVALLVLAILVLRDPDGGRSTIERPGFALQVPAGARTVSPAPGERLRVRRGSAVLTVRTLNATAALLILATDATPGVIGDEEGIRLDGAPAYVTRSGRTVRLFALPRAGAKSGLVVTVTGGGPLRSALRSLQFRDG